MKNKPFIYIQDVDIYNTDIIVSVDLDKKTLKRFLDKQKIKKALKKELLEDDNIFQVPQGMAIRFESGGYMLLLVDYKDKWEFWETLMHECSHIVDFMAQQRSFVFETEARAYLHEYLFRNIRRRIYKNYKK